MSSTIEQVDDHYMVYIFAGKFGLLDSIYADTLNEAKEIASTMGNIRIVDVTT